MLCLTDCYLTFVPLLTYPYQPTHRLISPSKASNPLLEFLKQLLSIQNHVSTMSPSKNIQALS